MNSPEFSVIIPVYNRQGTVARSVNSVLSQSFSDFELLVVDDASSDDSVDIVSKIKDDRIKLLALKTNRGPGGARNEALKVARGRLIAFLDSDDAYEPDFLQETFDHFASSDESKGFCWTGIWIHNGSDRTYSYWMPKPGPSLYTSFLFELKIGTSTGLSLKREVLAKIGFFDESFEVGEDTDLLLRMSRYYEKISINKPLVSRYFNEANRLTYNYEKTLHAYLRHIDAHGLEIKSNKILLNRFGYKICWLAYYTGNKRIAREHWKMVSWGSSKVKATLIMLLFEIFPLAQAKAIHRKLYHINN